MRAPKTIPIGLAPVTDMALDTGPGIGAGRWGTMLDPTVLWDLAGTVVMGDLAPRVRRQVCPEHVLFRHLMRPRNSERNIKRSWDKNGASSVAIDQAGAVACSLGAPVSASSKTSGELGC